MLSPALMSPLSKTNTTQKRTIFDKENVNPDGAPRSKLFFFLFFFKIYR